HRNRYYNLQGMWVIPSDSTKFTLEDFNLTAKDVPGGKGESRESLYKTNVASIWESPAPLEEKSPKKTFAFKADIEELRLPDRKTPRGIRECAWGDMPQPAFVPRDAPGVKLAANEKLVAPDDPAEGNVFPDVNSALSRAKPGDVILLKRPKS